MFGGERDIGTDAGELMTSLMVLDTDLMLWYPPAANGSSPAARCDCVLLYPVSYTCILLHTHSASHVSPPALLVCAVRFTSVALQCMS